MGWACYIQDWSPRVSDPVKTYARGGGREGRTRAYSSKPRDTKDRGPLPGEGRGSQGSSAVSKEALPAPGLGTWDA